MPPSIAPRRQPASRIDSCWYSSAAPWCTACHHLENDIRNQPGAAAALEANFVPVKINFDYYPNTAKQYGVTRLPTTVILAPNAQGEVLAVIPEYMPVDQYLSKLNKVAADAKRREQRRFCPDPGQPAGRVSCRDCSAAGRRTCDTRQSVAPPRLRHSQPPVDRCRPPLPPACPPTILLPPSWLRRLRQTPAASPMVAMATGPALSGSRPLIRRNRQRISNRPPIRSLASMVSAPCSLWKTLDGSRARRLGGPFIAAGPICSPGRRSNAASWPTPTVMRRSVPATTWSYCWNRAVRCRATASMACSSTATSICSPVKARWKNSAPTPTIMPIGPCRAMRSAAQTAAVR